MVSSKVRDTGRCNTTLSRTESLVRRVKIRIAECARSNSHAKTSAATAEPALFQASDLSITIHDTKTNESSERAEQTGN